MAGMHAVRRRFNRRPREQIDAAEAIADLRSTISRD